MSSIFIPSLATVRKFGAWPGSEEGQKNCVRGKMATKTQWIRGFGENSAENYA